MVKIAHYLSKSMFWFFSGRFGTKCRSSTPAAASSSSHIVLSLYFSPSPEVYDSFLLNAFQVIIHHSYSTHCALPHSFEHLKETALICQHMHMCFCEKPREPS